MPSEAALLHFLKPYKRVYNASVCTHAVDHVTFWVYDRGQWIRHDGGKLQPNKSWCHSFFKTVLGLSQTEYDKAKKRLFAGEDLTGVYRSGNSFAVVYRPSSTLSRAHIAAIVAGGLVAGGVGLAAKKKFQQKPATSALTANKTPEPQGKASDIKRLEDLFIEFSTKIQNDEKIDQRSINEYLKIYLSHEGDASFVTKFELQRNIVKDIITGFDFQKFHAVLEKTNAEIANFALSQHAWNWEEMAEVYEKVFQDLKRAEQIRAAMYFQQRVSGKDDEAFKQLVCHSLDSNRGERYNNAIKELMEVSKQSNAPVLEVDVYDFKWRCLWDHLADAIIYGKAIDQTKLSEFKAISLQLEEDYPHRFDAITFKAPDFVSLFLLGGQTLDAMDAILDEDSFERIIQNKALSHVGPASFGLLTWLYALSEKNGNEDDISRLRKSDAAFHYYLIKSMLDRGEPVAGERYFVELVNYAVMDELEMQSNPGYENYEYFRALNELAVRYGEAFQAEVQTCAEQQRKKIRDDLEV